VGPEFGGGALQPVLVAAGDDDGVAVGGETGGDGPPDAVARPR
jgi:hypothetical protein